MKNSVLQLDLAVKEHLASADIGIPSTGTLGHQAECARVLQAHVRAEPDTM